MPRVQWGHCLILRIHLHLTYGPTGSRSPPVVLPTPIHCPLEPPQKVGICIMILPMSMLMKGQSRSQGDIQVQCHACHPKSLTKVIGYCRCLGCSFAVPFCWALGVWPWECTLTDIVDRQSTHCDFTCQCPPSIHLIQWTFAHIVWVQLPQALWCGGSPASSTSPSINNATVPALPNMVVDDSDHLSPSLIQWWMIIPAPVSSNNDDGDGASAIWRTSGKSGPDIPRGPRYFRCNRPLSGIRWVPFWTRCSFLCLVCSQVIQTHSDKCQNPKQTPHRHESFKLPYLSDITQTQITWASILVRHYYRPKYQAVRSNPGNNGFIIQGHKWYINYCSWPHILELQPTSDFAEGGKRLDERALNKSRSFFIHLAMSLVNYQRMGTAKRTS